MKKLFFSFAGSLLLLSGCNRDEIPVGDGQPTAVNVTAQLSANTDRTRANGDASKINRFILQVYKSGQPYGDRKVQDVSPGTTNVSFNLQLIASQTYDFIFWADCSNNGADNHYDTSDLTSVTLSGDYAGNDDSRDAFFAKQTAEITGAFTMNVTLKRPFGQMNVKSTDFSGLPAEFRPDAFNISFKDVYTTFNALTGTVSGSQTLNYTSNASISDSDGTLSMDYLFAPGSEQALTDFTMTFYKGGALHSTNDKFTSIPVKRNYRTNVSGNLFTKQGSISVTVRPGFDGEQDREITEVSTPQDITQALKDGKTDVVLTTAPDAPATIELPKTYTSVDNTPISITLPATTQLVTIAYEATGAANPPAELTVSAPQTEKLIINTPQTSVGLSGQHYNAVETTTAPSTLTVGSDVTIQTLTAKQGNIKLYGTITTLTKESGYTGTIIRCVASTEDMARAATDNISGYEYLLVEKSAIGVDGKGATFTKPLRIAANAGMGNFTINSQKDNGITIDADDIDVTLNNVTVYQNEANVSGAKNCAILAASHNNVSLNIRDSHLIVPKAGQRGINIHSATDPNSICTVSLDNTHIGPALEIIGAGDYSEAQNVDFKKKSDSRGINIGAHGGKVIVNMRNNSDIEGVFYAINITQITDYYEINVDNSRLDGRCAFNIWGDANGVINVTNNSKLIGRNPFAGSTEEFATIIVCENSGAWLGAANNVITVKDSEIYCYNSPETPTNLQYAAQLRSPRKNTLNLLGATKIYDKSPTQRLPYAIEIQDPINEVNVDSTVVFDGNSTATILSKNK